jgi:6-phosphogluconate dehydrogenase (decarboxylating)
MAVDREHWRALKAAVDEAVSTPVLASAIFTAMGRDDAEFSTGLLAAVEREYRGAVESIGR